MPLIAAVFVVSTVTTALALQPRVLGTSWMWLLLVVVHGCLGGMALRRWWQAGTFAERLTPRGGDFTIGVLAAATLLVGSWILRSQLAPMGEVSSGWIAQTYLAIGDPNALQRSTALTLAVLGTAACSELAWRGLAQDLLEERCGSRWGWLVTSGLFTLAASPSVLLLADPVAGPNPLVMVAAGVCGLTWGLATRVLRRLWPAMFSHMTFLYFTAVQFHMPGISIPGL